MKKLKISSIVLFIFGVFSCELPDNVNPKLPAQVPVGYLFGNAEIALTDHLFALNVNGNISMLLAQYMSQTTYFGESRYNFLDRNIPDGFWGNTYRDVLMDLIAAKKNLEATQGMIETEKNNQLAAIDVLIVYAFHVLVDQFGNIPYTDALKGDEDPTPKYDDAKTIYVDLINRLTNAINKFNTTSPTFTSSSDIYLKGSTAKWIAFAASLKLRLGMRLADCDNALAKATVESVASQVITSEANNVTFAYLGSTPYNHPWYEEFVIGGRRNNWMASNTIIDLMQSLSDPRIPQYFVPATVAPNVGLYVGAPYGQSNAATYRWSSFNTKTYRGTMATGGGNATVTLIDNVEVEFLLAEAVERGYNVGGTAEGHYNNAITASLTAWGCSSSELSNYLARTDVAYSTATGTYKQKIGTQKWIALYGRGVEAWAEWRRLDYPILNIPAGMQYSDIPVRMPYPFFEDNYNLANYTDAVKAMGGTDNEKVKLFWDLN